MPRNSDLAPLFIEGNPDEMGYRQGTVTAWNVSAGTNQVNIGGNLYDDIPVLGRIAAMSTTVGDVVGIMRYRDQYFILGLIGNPATNADVTLRGGDLRFDGANIELVSGDLRISGGDVVLEDAGSFEVEDDSSTTQVRMGSLTSEPGEYGLEQRVESNFVPLAALAGGAATDSVFSQESLVVSSGGDSGWTDLATTGPSVTFTTYTGRWVLMLFANLSAPVDGGSARLGFETSGAQSWSAANVRSALAGFNGPASAFVSQTYARVFTGSAGEITVTMKYRAIAPASFPIAPNWDDRTIVVIPY